MMDENDLKGHLEGLFSEIAPGSEPKVEPEEKAGSLEDALVYGILEGKSAPSPDAIEQAGIPLSATDEPKEALKGKEVPTPKAPSWRIALGKQRISVLNALLIVLGGVPLVFLLINFVRQGAVGWTGFPLYLAFYTLAVVVTLVQWLFNSSLSRALRESEERREEILRSQAPFEGQLKGLAAASARLQKRTLQFQTVAQVSRAITSVLNQDRLLREVVNLTYDRFDLYFVGLYLIDESGEWATLQAGTGEAGAQMLAQGHRVEATGNSVVGRCIAGAQARIAMDAVSAQARLLYEDASTELDEVVSSLDSAVDVVEENSLLPKTHSEMVLPLLAGGRVVGALDIHSTKREAFSAGDIPVLRVLADQIAVAIGNAQRFAKLENRVEELEQRHVQEQRARLAIERAIPMYERTQPDVPPLGDVLPPEIEQAVTQQEMIVQSGADEDGKQAALVSPVTLRGEVIGALGLQELKDGRQWTDDEIALIEAVAGQMALAIENARLLESTRRRAERERLTTEISAQVRASTKVDSILRTAIRELGRTLRASDGVIQLKEGDSVSALQTEDGTVDDDGAST
jgi:GAF domain-containing protein